MAKTTMKERRTMSTHTNETTPTTDVTTEETFVLLTLDEIEEFNPQVAEVIRSMESPVPQNAAIKEFSRQVHEALSETVEEQEESARRQVRQALKASQPSPVKEAGRSIFQSAKGFGRTVSTGTSKFVGEVKETVHEAKVEREARKVHEEEQILSPENKAKAEARLQAKKVDDDDTVAVIA